MSDAPFIERTLAGLGIDRAVGWTVAARMWSMLAGPLSVILIASHLSAEEQGFYYTFASVVSFQTVFELGLGMVIVQFASHEKAFLEWRSDGTLTGSDVEKRRLATLFRKTLEWYAAATALATAVLLVGGTIFFAHRHTSVETWRAPWIAVAILAGGALVLTPFLSVIEGCGRIADVARVRTWQVIASNLVAWSVLLAGGRLWASAAVLGGSLLVGSVWLLATHRPLFTDLLRTRGGGISWREEVWPFQWRIAVSWISSYFTFHFFIPVLFSARGPVAAGKMGMSLTLASAVFFVATSLVTTRTPRYGELIARRDFAELDAQFFPAMWRAFGAMALGAAALLGGTFLLPRIGGHRWSDRLLDPLPFALLLATFLINTLFFAEAVYLRAHKQEPLLGIFIASGIAVATCAVTLGRTYGATGMMLGYFVTTLVISLGGGTWVFVRKRREWHG
jgi:O-antigen/teichoic acid export membrane protein